MRRLFDILDRKDPPVLNECLIYQTTNLECAKYCGSRAIVGLVNLVLLWVFHESKIFDTKYFVCPNILSGVFREYFVGPNFFS